MSKITEYKKPQDIKEAIKILTELKNKAKILAGGTHVLNSHGSSNTLIDIKGLGLNYVKKNKDAIHIGATVTISDLIESPYIRNYCGGMLYSALYGIGSTQLRNIITAGGAAVQVMPWSDLPLVLLLLDADIIYENKNGSHKISYRKLLERKHPRLLLTPGEIITELQLKTNINSKGKFIKFAKTTFDFAILDAAVILKIANKKITDIEFGVSAASGMPQLLSSASLLKGASVNDTALIDEICRKAAIEAKVLSDFRVSVKYKRHLIRTLLKRLIEELINESKRK